VDGDRAAAMIAGALGARQLIILSNVPGLLRAFPDESTLIPHIKFAELEQALSFAEGRMKKKVLGASEALAGGVAQVVFGDARTARPIFNAMNGQGTVIER
jgi:acetylglutamate/LysW-gamma-L-alpha-aminoadipate kinase